MAVATAVDNLTAKFDETVSRLIVPKTVVIKPLDREPYQVKGYVHPIFEEILIILQSGRFPFLIGPVGCGKSTLAEQCAEALDVPFRSNGTVLASYDIMGYMGPNGYVDTPFHDAYVNGRLWLADEGDSWSPDAFLAANQALSNGHTTFAYDNVPKARHIKFYAMMAANTWGHGADREHVGRNELDAATLSRFVSVPMDYDEALERSLSQGDTEWLDMVHRCRRNARALKVHATFGTRELMTGLDLMRSGLSRERTTELVLRRNLDATQWSKVSDGTA
jgi:MoxR-like ATPase